MIDEEDAEILREFILESRENLDQLDSDLVVLETTPDDTERLASIFRAIHSIKGAAGFFELVKLETLTHAGETLLSKLRDAEIGMNTTRTTCLLKMVDRVRELLGQIERSGTEGTQHDGALIEALTMALDDARLDEVVEIVAELGCAEVAPQPQAALADQEAPKPASKLMDARTKDERIRVEVGLLDALMNLVGELVLARNQLVQRLVDEPDLELVGASQRLSGITTELQESVMKTRMQPIDTVWSRYPRIVRDLSRMCGKEVKLEMSGRGTELDKSILEAIADPMAHLVRNAVDHGIEVGEVRAGLHKPTAGTLRLRAFHEGGRVNIEIEDDGGGIDPARVRDKAIDQGLISRAEATQMSASEILALVFHPGFSTAKEVTNISGRGVGMDVVKTNIERIGGTVDVESTLGVGSVVRIRIPLTLAIIPALIVRSGNQRFALPQVSLVELVRLEPSDARSMIEEIYDSRVLRLRGNLLALVDLSETLQLESPRDASSDVNVVVVQADDRQFGLVVDEVLDTEEIVVKPLGAELKGTEVFAGATIMGDGQVALILDVMGVASRAGVDANPLRELEHASQLDERDGLLVFRTGEARMAMALTDVARLEEFPRTAIEEVAGETVIQYRGSILPLIDLGRFFDEDSATAGETIHVVVHSDGSESVGFVVDAIEDIVDEAGPEGCSAARLGSRGSVVIQGRVTELLDPMGIRSGRRA